MTPDELEEAINDALDRENYERAAELQAELNRRHERKE
jgi:protein-arginine kinase activator protein McsA